MAALLALLSSVLWGAADFFGGNLAKRYQALAVTAVSQAFGLIIGILQAATSINEATLSFIPKLAALAITLAVVGGWQLTTLVDYTRGIFQRIPGLFT